MASYLMRAYRVATGQQSIAAPDAFSDDDGSRPFVAFWTSVGEEDPWSVAFSEKSDKVRRRGCGRYRCPLYSNVRSLLGECAMTENLDTELADLLAVDVSGLSVGEHCEHMAALQRAKTRFDAVVLSRLAAFDRSAAWQLDAAYNSANWLAAQTGTARAVAGSAMKLANRLQQMPATGGALAAGSITESHARVLARCIANPRVRDLFSDAEPNLVARAMEVTADELSRVVDEWIELMDQDGAEPHDPEHDTVSANRVGDRVKVNADLGLETGLPFLAALNERTDQIYKRDQKVSEINPNDGLSMRSPGERRGEAFVELVLAGAAAGSNPRRREPLFVVHVDEDTFVSGRRHPDTLLEVDRDHLPVDIMERYRCGSRYQTFVQDAARQVLYLGRTERYASRELRRALAARDRGCAVPGCDRPPAHCDAHHVVFWENWGTSDVDSMILACRHHHRMIHAWKLRVAMVNGVPYFQDQFGNDLYDGKRRRPPDVQAA